jgi:hypothetical protein
VPAPVSFIFSGCGGPPDDKVKAKMLKYTSFVSGREDLKIYINILAFK